ncbi:transcriptional regulator [Shewanella putrefaciens]|nr:transcriptional regulator [Shewanella putrefaciens]
MDTAFQRDQLDNHILEALMQDARTPLQSSLNALASVLVLSMLG